MFVAAIKREFLLQILSGVRDYYVQDWIEKGFMYIDIQDYLNLLSLEPSPDLFLENLPRMCNQLVLQTVSRDEYYDSSQKALEVWDDHVLQLAVHADQRLIADETPPAPDHDVFNARSIEVLSKDDEIVSKIRNIIYKKKNSEVIRLYQGDRRDPRSVFADYWINARCITICDRFVKENFLQVVSDVLGEIVQRTGELFGGYLIIIGSRGKIRSFGVQNIKRRLSPYFRDVSFILVETMDVNESFEELHDRYCQVDKHTTFFIPAGMDCFGPAQSGWHNREAQITRINVFGSSDTIQVSTRDEQNRPRTRYLLT